MNDIFIYALILLTGVIIVKSYNTNLTTIIHHINEYETNQQYVLLFIQNPTIRATLFLLCLLTIETNPFISLFAFVGIVSSLHLKHFVKTFGEYTYFTKRLTNNL